MARRAELGVISPERSLEKMALAILDSTGRTRVMKREGKLKNDLEWPNGSLQLGAFN